MGLNSDKTSEVLLGLKVVPGLPGRRPGTDLFAIYLPGLYRVACFYSFSAHNYSNFTD